MSRWNTMFKTASEWRSSASKSQSSIYVVIESSMGLLRMRRGVESSIMGVSPTVVRLLKTAVYLHSLFSRLLSV